MDEAQVEMEYLYVIWNFPLFPFHSPCFYGQKKLPHETKQITFFFKVTV